MSQRIPLEQTGQNIILSVTNVVQAIAPNFGLAVMTQSFILCNPASNTVSVFWGFGSNITSSSGIEITPGSAPLITIDQVRQLYELQDPMRLSATVAACQEVSDQKIPVIAFDLSHIYIVAAVAGPTTCSALIFNNVYV